MWLDKSGIEAAMGMELDECPGLAISLPEVIEASRAAGWADDSLLVEFYEGEEPTRLVLDCIEILRGAVREVESDEMRTQRRKLKQQHGGG